MVFFVTYLNGEWMNTVKRFAVAVALELSKVKKEFNWMRTANSRSRCQVGTKKPEYLLN